MKQNMYLNNIQQNIHDLSIFVTFKYIKKDITQLQSPLPTDDKEKEAEIKRG